jgi:hypothetical protein
MELFIMEGLDAITKGELARQTGISVASVENIAGFYSKRMKNSMTSGEFTPLSMDGLRISRKSGYYWVLNGIGNPDGARNIMMEAGKKRRCTVLFA